MAADQRNEQDDCAERYPRAVVRSTLAKCLGMEDDIAEREHANNAEHPQIAPVLAGDYFARGNRGKRQQERDVDYRGGNAANFVGKQDRNSPGKPERGKPGKRPAVYGQTASPVRNGGKQKAGDRGCDVAEQHLVNVPVERGEMRRQHDVAKKLRQPEWKADDGPEARQEKERTEAV